MDILEHTFELVLCCIEAVFFKKFVQHTWFAAFCETYVMYALLHRSKLNMFVWRGLLPVKERVQEIAALLVVDAYGGAATFKSSTHVGHWLEIPRP